MAAGNRTTDTAVRSGALVPLPRPAPEPEPLPVPRRGDVDEWGRSESIRAPARQLFDPIYSHWFRAEWEGLENIPLAGGALLVLTGLYAFWKARRDARRNEPEHSEALDNPKLLITAFAISLDNLVVGFALSFSRTPILLAAAIIAAVSVGMSMVGLELGDRLGGKVGEWSEEIGAGVLVLVGVAIAAGLFR